MELDGHKYVGYGIAAEEEGKIIKAIEDISLNSKDVEGLVSCCNEESLESVHLEDVVNDFLAACRA